MSSSRIGDLQQCTPSRACQFEGLPSKNEMMIFRFYFSNAFPLMLFLHIFLFIGGLIICRLVLDTLL